MADRNTGGNEGGGLPVASLTLLCWDAREATGVTGRPVGILGVGGVGVVLKQET